MTGGARSPIRSASLSVEDDKGCVIPAQAGIQSEWIPHQVQDDKECVIPAQAGIQSVISGSPIKLGMTGGDGSPIRSALLSVEDDKGCVITVKTGIQSEWIPHQVRDDKECVIPVKTGIQAGLDPQSETLRFRLRTA